MSRALCNYFSTSELEGFVDFLEDEISGGGF